MENWEGGGAFVVKEKTLETEGYMGGGCEEILRFGMRFGGGLLKDEGIIPGGGPECWG